MSSPSFFSSEEFLGAIAAAAHPGKPWRRDVVEVEGRHFRVLVAGGRVVDAQWNHPFRYDPIEPAEAQPSRTWPYLAATTLEIRDAPVVERFRWPVRPSPFVDWRAFSSWAEYQRFAHQPPHPAHWTTIARLERKLEREHGPVVVSFDDRRPDVIPTLARLKGAHFRRTGNIDWFSTPETVRIYAELQSRGVFSYATLRANGRLAAIIAGSHWERSYCARTLTYEPGLGLYSPGLILLHQALRRSLERGDTEFDFLGGYEQYKWEYATHARIVGPIGRQARRDAIEHWARDKAGAVLLRLRARLSARPGGAPLV